MNKCPVCGMILHPMVSSCSYGHFFDEKPLTIGTQIAFIPVQAKGDLNHRDVWYGFVIAEGPNYTSKCILWQKDKPGMLHSATVEEMENYMLRRVKTVSEYTVRNVIKEIIHARSQADSRSKS